MPQLSITGSQRMWRYGFCLWVYQPACTGAGEAPGSAESRLPTLKPFPLWSEDGSETDGNGDGRVEERMGAGWFNHKRTEQELREPRHRWRNRVSVWGSDGWEHHQFNKQRWNKCRGDKLHPQCHRNKLYPFSGVRLVFENDCFWFSYLEHTFSKDNFANMSYKMYIRCLFLIAEWKTLYSSSSFTTTLVPQTNQQNEIN